MDVVILVLYLPILYISLWENSATAYYNDMYTYIIGVKFKDRDMTRKCPPPHPS